MKKLAFFLTVLTFTLAACSSEPPGVRVTNQNAGKANVQIKMANANTININDVAPGTSSGYQEIAEGATLATAVIQNVKETPSIQFTAVKDKNYTVVVQAASPATLKVDIQDK